MVVCRERGASEQKKYNTSNIYTVKKYNFGEYRCNADIGCTQTLSKGSQGAQNYIPLGARAMTTKFLDNTTFALSKYHCRGVSQEKKRFWPIFLSSPNVPPPPPQKYNIYFHCRLAVSEPPPPESKIELWFPNSTVDIHILENIGKSYPS